MQAAEQRERKLFLAMALSFAAMVVLGFGAFAVIGRSSFASPWWVHLHAASFLAWIGFYVAQNLLVTRNALVLHRRLGTFGACLAAWMVLLGLILTPLTLATGRAPRFFTPAYFLALDWLNILAFAGLVFAGFKVRKRSDWHRRLMLCATLCVIKPALSRLLIVVTGNAAPLKITLAMLAYLALVIFLDWNNRGKFHAAWL